MTQTLDAHEESDKPGEPTEKWQLSALNRKLLLSVAQAAELLGVSKRTVYLLLASGELIRKKVRRRTMIHRDDVLRFAADRRTESRHVRN
jgi:excisionase family DNA binding protein